MISTKGKYRVQWGPHRRGPGTGPEEGISDRGLRDQHLQEEGRLSALGEGHMF